MILKIQIYPFQSPSHSPLSTNFIKSTTKVMLVYTQGSCSATEHKSMPSKTSSSDMKTRLPLSDLIYYTTLSLCDY